MKYGYYRIWDMSQSNDLQIIQLKEAGADYILSDIENSAAEYPNRDKLIHNLKHGDLIIFHSIYEAAESLKLLHFLVKNLQKKLIPLVFVKEKVDTRKKDLSLEYIFKLIYSFNFRHKSKTTIEGLKLARFTGKKDGRKKGLSTDTIRKAKEANKLYGIANYELERLILGFGDSMKVLAPENLKKRILSKLHKAINNYKDSILL